MLKIDKTIEKDKAVFVLDGPVDSTTAPYLDKALRESIDGITDLSLDIEKVDYISSAGLRVLLFAQKTMNRQGRLTVLNVCREVMDLFEATGFSDVLTIINKPAAAEAEAEAEEPEEKKEQPATLR